MACVLTDLTGGWESRTELLGRQGDSRLPQLSKSGANGFLGLMRNSGLRKKEGREGRKERKEGREEGGREGRKEGKERKRKRERETGRKEGRKEERQVFWK